MNTKAVTADKLTAGDEIYLDTDRGSLIQIKSVGTSYTQASAAHDLAEQTIKGLDPADIQVMLIVTEQTNGPFREDATAPEPSTFWCDLLVRIWTTPNNSSS